MLNLTTEENDKLEPLYSARMLDWQGYGWSIICSRHAVAAQCNLSSQFEKNKDKHWWCSIVQSFIKKQ